MNRNGFLLASVREWVKLPLPIVIVDWSSKIPVRETLSAYRDRITIVEAPGKEFFNSSKSKNLSYRAACRLHPETEFILSLDCDVYVANPDAFLASHRLEPDLLYVGGPRGALPGEPSPLRSRASQTSDQLRNKWGTFGSFLCAMALLDSVNMFDERMEGYGVFDMDLYARIEATRARRRAFDEGALVHQSHVGRMDNFRDPDLWSSILDNVRLSRKVKWGAADVQEKHACVVHAPDDRAGGRNMIL
jgi:hypothetical protein